MQDKDRSVLMECRQKGKGSDSLSGVVIESLIDRKERKVT